MEGVGAAQSCARLIYNAKRNCRRQHVNKQATRSLTAGISIYATAAVTSLQALQAAVRNCRCVGWLSKCRCRLNVLCPHHVHIPPISLSIAHRVRCNKLALPPIKLSKHDDFCANLDPIIEVDDVAVRMRIQPEETAVPIVSGSFEPWIRYSLDPR
jgi:hypothetical protein